MEVENSMDEDECLLALSQLVDECDAARKEAQLKKDWPVAGGNQELSLAVDRILYLLRRDRILEWRRERGR